MVAGAVRRDDPGAAVVTVRRALAIVFELATLAASLGGTGPLADSVRTVAVVVVAALGALVVFVAAVFALGVLDQRKPPYPI
jgi:hypothetical protein